MLLSVATLSMAACTVPVKPQAPEVESNGVTEYKLKNGLKVLVKPDRRAPVFVSQLWYKVGSSYEYSGITGLSHMLEHMMFKGTDDLESGEFSDIIAMNGGRDNAATGRDYTWYYQSIARDRLELSLRLEAGRMRGLRFVEEEFIKERDVVAEERRMRFEDNPQALLYELFGATAYVNSPYHHAIIGWMADIQSYSVEDARQWYDAWYAPNNATLVIVGDVEPGQVIKLAKQYFGPLQPSEIPALKPQLEIPQQGKRRVELKRPARVPYLMMGYKVPSLVTAEDKNEAYALEVLGGILNAGESARLARGLVRGQELALGAGASYNLYSRLQTLLTLSAVPVAGVTVEQLQQALLKEVNRLKTELVSAEELERVKAQVVASDVYERDSMYYQAMLLGTVETVGMNWQVLDEYVPKVQAVTAEQVQAVARKYLKESALTVAELIPVKHGQEVQ